MAWTHAGQYGPEDLRRWNSVSQQLTYPTSVTVFQHNTSTMAQIYTTSTRTAVATNPLAINVTPNSVGVDTNGNLLFFAEPDVYDLSIDGTTYTVHIPPFATDLSNLLASINLQAL